jgi:hypothetical protein
MITVADRLPSVGMIEAPVTRTLKLQPRDPRRTLGSKRPPQSQSAARLLRLLFEGISILALAVDDFRAESLLDDMGQLVRAWVPPWGIGERVGLAYRSANAARASPAA